MMALRMVRSFRATAMVATILGFPASTSFWWKALRAGLKRAAAMAPVKRTVRTELRPPPMKLLPFHLPDWRVQGARPARAAISRRSRAPSSGISASRVRAMIGPTPGTVAQQILVTPPGRRAAHHVVDTLVELGQLLLQGQHEALDRAFDP